MEIKRDLYLNKLIKREKNGLVKIITGMRRCGKSYLLFYLYHDYLIKKGVPADHIIEIALDVYITGSNSKFLSSDILTELQLWGYLSFF